MRRVFAEGCSSAGGDLLIAAFGVRLAIVVVKREVAVGAAIHAHLGQRLRSDVLSNGGG